MFAKETLPAPPLEGQLRRERSRLARLLFSPEPLPQESPPPGAGPPGVLRSLFGAEPLPVDPPAPPRPRSHWLAWLFAPERLDRG